MLSCQSVHNLLGRHLSGSPEIHHEDFIGRNGLEQVGNGLGQVANAGRATSVGV